MKCPHCSVAFHPQMIQKHLGENGRKMHGHVYWQLCPECKEFVIGFKESLSETESDRNVEGLRLLEFVKS